MAIRREWCPSIPPRAARPSPRSPSSRSAPSASIASRSVRRRASWDSPGFRSPSRGLRRPARTPARRSPSTRRSSRVPRTARPPSRRSRRRIVSFRACYRRGLVHDPAQEGRVAIVLRVGADGHVAKVEEYAACEIAVESIGCMKAAAARLRFPPPPGGSDTVLIPAAFTSRDGVRRSSGTHQRVVHRARVHRDGGCAARAPRVRAASASRSTSRASERAHSR